MEKWDIYLVVVSLLGTGLAIAKPVLSLNSSITKLNAAINKLSLDLADLETSNKKSHERLWRHNDQQDESIVNHETRIAVLEHKGE